MVIKYDTIISNEAIKKNIDRIINQVFKLLPNREEGEDWKTPLRNIIIELHGMAETVEDHLHLFPILCNLEGLLLLDEDKDFTLFRKKIFETLSLIVKLKNEWFK